VSMVKSPTLYFIGSQLAQEEQKLTMQSGQGVPTLQKQPP